MTNLQKRLMAVLVLAFSSCLGAQTGEVTWKFRDGARGYHGTRDLSIAQHSPRENTGKNSSMMVGRRDAGTEFKTLVKFTGLNIPPGSTITSVRLTLCARSFQGTPVVAAYGLLRDFHEGVGKISPAQTDETCWAMAGLDQTVWGAPGAGKSAETPLFDGESDHLAQPDSVATGTRGAISFLVTPSFIQQFNHGKEYGWIIKEVTGVHNTHFSFYTREVVDEETPVTVQPELTVKFIPPPETRDLRGSEDGPRVINFYLGDPNRQILKHMNRVLNLPFDGAVFDAEDNRHHPNGEGNVNLSVFAPDKIKLEDYSSFIRAMKHIQKPPSPLQYNFLRICAVPGTLEKKEVRYHWENRPRYQDNVTMWWADGFDAVIHNWTVTAQIARQAGMKGILFDWEQYAGDMFNFEKLKDARDRKKNFDETRQQVRTRAREIIQAVNAVYPDLTLILIIDGYHEKHVPNLWNSFMDGLIEGADPRMKIVDGNEGGYGLNTVQEFKAVYDHDYSQAVSLCAVPDKYRRQVEVGFGVWLERRGWSADPELHNRSAAQWQLILENALAVADTYVWVFSGEGGKLQADWLTGDNLPESFFQATRKARELARKRKGFDPGF